MGMNGVPSPKGFPPPMPFGASMASNVLQQSNPVAQAPQQSFINLQDPSLFQYPQQVQQTQQQQMQGTQPPMSPFGYGNRQKLQSPDQYQPAYSTQ